MFKSDHTFHQSSLLLEQRNDQVKPLEVQSSFNHSSDVKINTEKDIASLYQLFSNLPVATENGDSSTNGGIELGKRMSESPTDSCKELLQRLLDTTRALDSYSSKVDSVEGLFSSELLIRRDKVKQLCEKLLFEQPEKYGLVSRDRLWRSVCYDVMCRAKRLRRGPSFTSIQQVYIKNHLLNGIAQLSLLLVKLYQLPEFTEAKYHRLKSDGFSNVLCMVLEAETRGGQGSDSDTKNQKSEELDKQLLDIIYMSLINIGDLYRYLTDVCSKDKDSYLEYFEQAQDYYSQAFLLNPASGLAHNQLGNLSLKLNNGLDSTYYLMYSMCSSIAYDGSYTNLRQLLDGQLVHLATMPAVAELSQLDTLAQSFLAVVYHFVCTDGTHLKDFQKSCQEALLAFHQILNSENEMENNLMARLALISIMIVWRLQATSSIYVSAAVAFASGIFLNLVNHLAAKLKAKCHLTSVPNNLPPSVLVTERDGNGKLVEIQLQTQSPVPSLGLDSNKENKESKSKVCKDKKVSAALVPKRRKPGKRRSFHGRKFVSGDFYSSDDDDRDVDVDDSSDNDSDILLSAEEESLDGDFEESGDDEGRSGSSNESELEEERVDLDDDRYTESVSSNDCYSDGSSVRTSQSSGGGLAKAMENNNGNEIRVTRLTLSLDELMDVMEELHPIVVAVISFSRWFNTSPAVISALASNCDNIFLQNLCDVMNILLTVNWCDDEHRKSELKEASLLQDWNELISPTKQCEKMENLFAIELSEDRSMLGLTCFGNILRNLRTVADLTKKDRILVRTGRLLNFGRWLADSEGFSLTYSTEENMFKLQTAKEDKFYGQARKLKELRDKLDNEGKNVNDKLRDSWRKDRDRDRRSSRKGWDSTHKPFGKRGRKFGYEPYSEDTIYVFVDLPAVLKHFQIVRRLATYSKFLIVFPHSVHKTLDRLKDTEEEGSKEARIVVSWAERQKAVGAVRTLREHEKLALKMDYPQSLESDAWEFFDVLESCNYFRIQENKNGRPATIFFDDIRDKYRILYLSGHDLVSQPQKQFDPRVVGQIARVYVDRVTSYTSGLGRKFRKKKYNG